MKRVQCSGSGPSLEFRIGAQVSRKSEEVNRATGWEFQNRVKCPSAIIWMGEWSELCVCVGGVRGDNLDN